MTEPRCFVTDLNEKQRAHLKRTMQEISSMVFQKYIDGAKEHKSCLGDMSEEDILKNIEEEAIDLLVYVAALRIKRGES